MTKRTQLEITGVVVFVAVLILTYKYATYSAYSLCDRNYRNFAGEIITKPEISELLKQPEHEKLRMKIQLFSPCGHMYSGYNHLLLYAGIGWGLMGIGFLLGLDTLRGKNRSKT